MSINQGFLAEFAQEATTTRKCLERVPDDKFGWKPHEKSMTMSHLAIHLAEMPNWASAILGMDSLDLNPPGGEPYKVPEIKNNAELLAFFDKNIEGAKKAIAAAGDDAAWMQDWSLMSGGNTLMTMPRVVCVRTFVMNHVYHHRGQLSVYLRENNIPVPSIYGPSADEGSMG
jgi:uncharacterized damage-inducible protein DinB